jgi:hypothetical protein
MAFDRKAYISAYNKSHYQENKEKRKQQATNWYYSNQDKAKENVIKRYNRNKESIKAKNRIYNIEWRKHNPEYSKEWRQNNQQLYNDLSNRNYHRNKHKKKHIQAWRNILKRTLEYKGIKKKASTLDLLGYTSQQLKQRIECQFKTGMDWNNYGIYWEIDHKKAISRFNKNASPSIVNALSNLQPLIVPDNRKKSKKTWRTEF